MEPGRPVRSESHPPESRRRLAIRVTIVGVIMFLVVHVRHGGSIDALLVWPLTPFALALFALRSANVNTARSVACCPAAEAVLEGASSCACCAPAS